MDNRQPTNQEILQAMLVLLKAQVALIEMRLAEKTQKIF
jgi:hypothetical protein